MAGSQDAILTVLGKNFLSGDVVEWSGAQIATTYVSPTRLLATVPAALSANQSTAQIAVRYAGAGVSNSAKSAFSVTAVAPQIPNLNPGSAVVGDVGFIMTVEGSGFTPASTVSWDGGALSSTYVSANQLQAPIPAASIQDIGMHVVTVTTGSTTSSQLTFLTGQAGEFGYSYIKIPQPATDIVWNASQQVFYLSVPSTVEGPVGSPIVPANHDSVVVLDPKSGTITRSVPAGTAPGALAISDDDQYLYVGESESAAIQRFTLPNLTADINCPLGTDSQSRPHYPVDMQVQPGNSHTIAAVIGVLGISPSTVGLFIMDDCTARTNVASAYGVGNFAIMDSIQWNLNGQHVYASETEVIGGDNLFDATIDSNGAQLTAEYMGPSLSPIHYESSNGNLYDDFGFIVNASDGVEVGWFGNDSFGVAGAQILVDSEDPTQQMQMDIGAMIQDANLDTAFFAYTGGVEPSLDSCIGVAAFRMSTQVFDRGLIICPGGDIITHVLRWGSNGLAFIDIVGNVYLLAGTFVSGR